jgi:hypothetical protein
LQEVHSAKHDVEPLECHRCIHPHWQHPSP